MIQWILPIWPLVSLPFINPVWTSSISRFMCCWNLAWRIVSMPLFNSVQLLSRVWLFVTPMDCSISGLPVYHQLPEILQTHVLWAGDAIQLSHPLSSPSPPILNLFQYQGLYFLYLSLSLSLYFSLFLSLFYFLTLQYCIGFTIYQHESSGSFQMRQFFTSGSQSIGVSASIAALPMNIQDWAPLQWTGWISLQSKGFSRIFSNTRVQKHQFFGAQLPL